MPESDLRYEIHHSNLVQYCRFSELNYSGANAAFYLDNDEIHFRECCFILVCLSVCLL